MTGISSQIDAPTKQEKPSASGLLQTFVSRLERLTEEREALQADLKQIFTEAKGKGFDVKVLRQVLRRRKVEPLFLQEQDDLLKLYEKQLGMDL